MCENTRAIMLLSGGLDSRLAMKMMLNQGVKLHALNHTTCFCTCTRKSSCKHEAVKAAEEMNVPIKVTDVTRELLEIIQAPPHGYGSGVNPCIDCRILLLRSAARLMLEEKASFIVTGEVLGERPMSQRLDAMKQIESGAGVQGYVVRPLSAKVLEPTIPEKRGWVNRDLFCRITGRRRQSQFKLAEDLGITDYPCPAGGCRLTDPGYAGRMRDLMSNDGLSLSGVRLLQAGRHFRLGPRIKAIVGRNRDENHFLASHVEDADAVMEVRDHPGPFTIVRKMPEPVELRLAASITARYSDAGASGNISVIVRRKGQNEEILKVSPAKQEVIERLRV